MGHFKRIGFWIVILGVGIASAQSVKFLEIQGGKLNPKGARKSGLIFGANYGIAIDERVDMGLGISIFHKGYTQKTYVDTSHTSAGSSVQQVLKPLEYSTTIVPVTANVTLHLPYGRPLGFYVGGSLAYEWLFDRYTNYEDKKEDKARFSGWGWMARGGIELSIGSRSRLTGELFYNSSKVKGERKKIAGIPSWKEVDLSGLGFRLGLRLEVY